MTAQSRPPSAPSGHPIIGHSLDFVRRPFEFVARSTSECGNIYRVELPGGEVYVLAHPKHFRQVLVDDVDVFGKTDDFRRAFGNGLLSTEGQQWRRQREILQPLFHRNQIEGYADAMVEATQRRLATWKPGETRDIESEMQDLTLEILFATLFGRELPPGEGEELRTASDGLNKWFTPTSWLLPRWVPTPARREFDNSVDRLRTAVRRLLTEYENNDASNLDGIIDDGDARQEDLNAAASSRKTTLLSKLHESRNTAGADRMDREEIEDQLLTMIFAGYETTAAALAFAWHSLATNPDIRRAFHEELDTVLRADLPPQNTVFDLNLTNRIITETLRLYPPIHTIPRQTNRDVEVGGYRIPNESQIHLSIISVHRDERFYDDPLSFRPDRWTAAFEEQLPDFAFVPFGGGRRACIGRDFACLEATLVLATIAQQFRLDWNRAAMDFTITPEITTQTKSGLPMTIRQR